VIGQVYLIKLWVGVDVTVTTSTENKFRERFGRNVLSKMPEYSVFFLDNISLPRFNCCGSQRVASPNNWISNYRKFRPAVDTKPIPPSPLKEWRQFSLSYLPKPRTPRLHSCHEINTVPLLICCLRKYLYGQSGG
jgi:hypothetical protein